MCKFSLGLFDSFLETAAALLLYIPWCEIGDGPNSLFSPLLDLYKLELFYHFEQLPECRNGRNHCPADSDCHSLRYRLKFWSTADRFIPEARSALGWYKTTWKEHNPSKRHTISFWMFNTSILIYINLYLFMPNISLVIETVWPWINNKQWNFIVPSNSLCNRRYYSCMCWFCRSLLSWDTSPPSKFCPAAGLRGIRKGKLTYWPKKSNYEKPRRQL